MIRLGVSVACCGCVVLLSACGSGAGTSRADFTKSADAICVQEAQAEVNIGSRNAIASYQTGASQINALISARQSALKRLKALTPPANEKAAYQAFVQQWPAIEAGWRNGLATLKPRLAAHDLIASAYDQGGTTPQARYRSYALAAKVGLPSCAGKLPSADRSTLTHLNYKIQEQTGPWVCTKDSTGHWIAVAGGLQGCIQGTKQAVHVLPFQIHLSHLMGTGPLAQLVVVIPAQAGGPGLFTFVKQTGVRKFDDAIAVPPSLELTRKHPGAPGEGLARLSTALKSPADADAKDRHAPTPKWLQSSPRPEARVARCAL